MGIRMIGIDHSQAEIDVRTIFSFTKKDSTQALEILKNKKGICGCVMINTCNRMELWVSCSEDFSQNLYDMLCEIREVDPAIYREYFAERFEEEAIHHLFELTCGLKSRILGEDQIISQVKEALSQARECYVTDNVLEVLFRMAVTAAKKVKTEVSFCASNRSVVHQAFYALEAEGYTLKDKKCMVIGNGEMGKLSATVLKQKGADVTVTVRQYRSGMVEIPRGCKRIDYGERMTLLPECDLVISVTASPNYTLRESCIRQINLTHPLVLIDLAVPRDIDPEAGGIPGITLYDIDYFKADTGSKELKESIAIAKHILELQTEEFYIWYECRDIIPKIQEIKACAVEDLDLRIERIIRELPMDKRNCEQLQEKIDTAVSKVVNKMIFGLRDSVSQQTFRECVEGLGKIYEK